MTKDNKHQCQNCGNEIESDYCSSCGQVYESRIKPFASLIDKKRSFLFCIRNLILKGFQKRQKNDPKN